MFLLCQGLFLRRLLPLPILLSHSLLDETPGLRLDSGVQFHLWILGMYAHTASRLWESDQDVLKSGLDPQVCQDIASQLVNCKTGRLFNVILGCGRKKFLPNTTTDEYGKYGDRWDGVNLIHKWQSQKRGKNASYVYNTPQLLRVPEDTEYLLGLFGNSHCEYNRYRHQNLQPSLAQKTKAAIKVNSNLWWHGFPFFCVFLVGAF